jgi:hypothetical protein
MRRNKKVSLLDNLVDAGEQHRRRLNAERRSRTAPAIINGSTSTSSGRNGRARFEAPLRTAI